MCVCVCVCAGRKETRDEKTHPWKLWDFWSDGSSGGEDGGGGDGSTCWGTAAAAAAAGDQGDQGDEECCKDDFCWMFEELHHHYVADCYLINVCVWGGVGFDRAVGCKKKIIIIILICKKEMNRWEIC